MEDRSPSRPAGVAPSPPGARPTASPAALRFAMWLRRFGYVVFAFYLAWITLGPGEQDTRLPPDPGRMISSGLLAISIAAIFFGILIVWGERQRLPPAVRIAGPPSIEANGSAPAVRRRRHAGHHDHVRHALRRAEEPPMPCSSWSPRSSSPSSGCPRRSCSRGTKSPQGIGDDGNGPGYPVPRPRKCCHTDGGIIHGNAATALFAVHFPVVFGVLVGGGLGVDCGLSGRPLDRRGLPAFQQGTAAAGRPRRGAGCGEDGSRVRRRQAAPVGFLRSHCITLLSFVLRALRVCGELLLAPVPVAGGPARPIV